MNTQKRCPVCGGKIEICGGCKVDLTEAAIKALKKTGYDPTIKCSTNAKSRKRWIVTLCILLSVSAYGQDCCLQGGQCLPYSPILGECIKPCQCVPDEPPLFESGIIDWRPPGSNYVEGPWIVRIHNQVYIGGHAGWCCEDFRPDGKRAHDIFWTILYQCPGDIGDPVYRWRDLPDATKNDDHETGDYTPLYIGGQWLFFGGRTERSMWGQFNRLRPFTLTTKDPVFGDLLVNREPLFPPIQATCEEIGSVHPDCDHSIGCGQHISVVTTRDGRLLSLSKDDVGEMNHRTHKTSSRVVHLLDPVTREATFLYKAFFGYDQRGEIYTPSISDMVLGKDGYLYAYGGNTPVGLWYDSTAIIEWVSKDEGKTWAKTGRRWNAQRDNAIWDAGVMKNGGGWMADPFTLVAITAPKGSWATTGLWKLWYWTEDHTEMPFDLIWP